MHAYVNTGTGWEEHLDWAPGVNGGSRHDLRLADVNGDRKADYLMVQPSGTVNAYLNNWDRSDPDAPGPPVHRGTQLRQRHPLPRR
ncbi:hypothetical protein [Streptomyces sp. S.PNR 29]|uniref:hypothetical protein n=1 Tax=Streptomyces sp. S.PNR 29 TaxID=2973805 RepID=UPI00339D9D69